jgi:hypothetical protein
MKKLMWLTSLSLLLFFTEGFSQKPTRYLGEPIWVDSLSTIFFPTRYNEEIFSANKIAFWGDYYANIVVYDFKSDQYRKLFLTDTYIESLAINEYSTPRHGQIKNITSKWVFLLVKNKDYNSSGRIDERDPSILFVTNKKGEGLKSLTAENENIISISIYKELGFGLILITINYSKI